MAIKTAAQVARELEKKYKVTPSPWWKNLCAQGLTINGVLATVGREFVFKGANSEIICGAGIIAAPGLMRFSACYGLDRRLYETTGEITGLQIDEAILVCNPNGKSYDYYPTAIYTGEYSLTILTELFY